LADAEFLSESIIVYAGDDGITAYDAEKSKTLWQGRIATNIAVSGDGAVIAAVYKNENEAILYSHDGRELCEIDFGAKTMRVPADDSFINPRDTLFALNGDGRKLAVSFSDGSFSVFDIATGAETVLLPPSNAGWFAGGFFGKTLLVSTVQKELYSADFYVYDMPGGDILARYSSDSSHFTPYIGASGVYVAFEDQVMSVDTEDGSVSHIASAGGRVETFAKRGDTLLLCETGGPYRFIGETGGISAFQSAYPCHFADVGEGYALTGSLDSPVIRILKCIDGSGEAVLAYERAYRFSEAKLNAATGRAVFYSYTGLRLCDMAGNIVAEASFPNPFEVLDTRYDKQSGNVAALYESALLLYSGNDGSLLVERRGKPGAKSVFYTSFGVSVLEKSGAVTLYGLTDG
jgi:hypothetical protein